MKITLYSDYQYLKDSLPSGQESFPLLDLIGESRLKLHSCIQFIDHATFSLQEKQEMVEQYIQTIASLGNQNRYSVYWLCHPLSERNELMPGNVFEVLQDYLIFIQALSGRNDQDFSILTDKSAFVSSVLAFCRQNNIDCQLHGNWWLADNIITKARRFLGSLRNQWGLLKQKWAKAKQWHHLSLSLDNNKNYTILRSWFDQRSWPLITADKDVYYGRLPGFLKNNGRDILFYGDVIDPRFGPQDNVDSPSSNNLPPILMEGRFLKPQDFIKGIIFRLLCPFKVIVNPDIYIQNIDVTNVFKSYFNQQLNLLPLMSNYFTYLAVERLVKKVKMIQFINLFENYSWEKVTTLAIKESHKSILTCSFQHAQVSSNSLKFYLGEEEATHSPLPDKIITLGEITRHFMVNYRNFPSEQTITGCALRHDYQIPDHELPMQRKNRIQVYMWTLERSIEMLEFLNGCKEDLKDYEISVSTHPNHPIEKIKPHLSFTDLSFFKLATGSLIENFLSSDIVMYSGTTVCLDALANGIPVINVEFDDFLTPDPLFGFEEFKWTVHNGQELLKAIDCIAKLSDEEFYQRQNRGLDFVRQYFYAVNEDNMQTFLLQEKILD